MKKTGMFVFFALFLCIVLASNNTSFAKENGIKTINLSDKSYENTFSEEEFSYDSDEDNNNSTIMENIESTDKKSSKPEDNNIKKDEEENNPSAGLSRLEAFGHHKSKIYPEIDKSRIGKTVVLRYKVKKGDTFFKISRQFNVDINDLKKANKQYINKTLQAGTTLLMPITIGGNQAKKEISILENPAPDTKKTKKSSKKSGKTQYAPLPVASNHPEFKWPIKKIIDVRSDGSDGVRQIGIIITGKPGSEVVSSADGIVKKIGYIRGFGNFVVVSHPNRFMTIYSNIDTIYVKEKETVKDGSMIGKLNSENNRLHFQINYAGKPQNALALLPGVKS